MKNETVNVPASISDILADLRGFGIEDFAETLEIEIGGRKLQIRLSNIPTEADLLATMAVEEQKGYRFFQEVKIEILSRSISWINGVDIKNLTGNNRVVRDPVDGNLKDIQVVLRGIIKSWGLETMQVLWKVLMIHSQAIEDRLYNSFPDAAVMTDVERRYRDTIQANFDLLSAEALNEKTAELFKEDENERN